MPTAVDVTLARLAAAAYLDQATGLPPSFTPVPAESLALALGPGASYADGVYRNGNAAALVTSGSLGGVPTLVLAFRGSDDRQDSINSLENTAADYPDFAPLIAAIEAQAATGDFGQVLVTGHSLGGALTQTFMDAHPGGPYRAVTFGSPGAPIAEGPDPRITNHVVADDPAVFLGENRAAVGEALRADPLLAATAIFVAADIFPGLTPSDAAQALPNLTGDYENRGATALVPGADGSLAPLADLDAVLNTDAAEHRVENYVTRLSAAVAITAGQAPEPAIAWQHADGTPALWKLAGAQVADADVLPSPGSFWTLAGSGDFNADARTDLLWRGQDGAVALWTMDGVGNITGDAVVANPGTFWSVAGTGDFNADFRSDILWRGEDGGITLWTMDGTRVIESIAVAAPGSSWNVAGTGDFDADGRTDALFRGQDGAVAVWTMDGGQVTGAAELDNPGGFWEVAGTGDFDGDARTDILWRGEDGSITLWTMDGTQVAGSAAVADPGSFWKVDRTGDYNSDGLTDILFRGEDGSVVLWTMDGARIVGSDAVAGIPTEWQILA